MLKYPRGYLEFKNTYEQNFNGYTHVFEVHLFNDVVDDITGSRIIPEIDMAGIQTGSCRISICMTAINKSATATPLKMDIQHPRKFGNIRWNSSSISPASRDVVTSGLDVCDIYFRYKTTSYNTKHGYSCWNFVTMCAETRDMMSAANDNKRLYTSGFGAAIVDFW